MTTSFRFVLLTAVLAALSACGPELTQQTLDQTDDVASAEADALSTPGHFETFTGKDGKVYFHLIAGNGQKVLGSQGYASQSGALSGIASVQVNGVNEARYLQRQAVDGSPYFVLVAGNGEIIGVSQMYASVAGAQHAVTTLISIIKAATVDGPVALGNAKAQVFRGLDGKYFFHVRAANGEIVLASQAYASRSGALNGVSSVQTNGTDAGKYEVRAAADGKSYFVLKAGNGQIIGLSEMYESRANAEQGVATLVSLLQGTSIH